VVRNAGYGEEDEQALLRETVKRVGNVMDVRIE
jgi:hypothetical protein